MRLRYYITCQSDPDWRALHLAVQALAKLALTNAEIESCAKKRRGNAHSHNAREVVSCCLFRISNCWDLQGNGGGQNSHQPTIMQHDPGRPSFALQRRGSLEVLCGPLPRCHVHITKVQSLLWPQVANPACIGDRSGRSARSGEEAPDVYRIVWSC